MEPVKATVLISTIGGGTAFILRLAQRWAGLPHWLLPALLAVLLAALLLPLQRLPSGKINPRPFQDVFHTGGTPIPAFLGLALVLLSGLMQVRAGLATAAALAQFSAGGSEIVSGFLRLGMALFLLPAVGAASGGRHSRRRAVMPAVPLLLPPLTLTVQLVLSYRQTSANPSIDAYYLELLALSWGALAFFRLSSFAFGDGDPARFAFWASGAFVLCLAALADGPPLSTAALLGGCAVTLLAFLQAMRPAPSRRQPAMGADDPAVEGGS